MIKVIVNGAGGKMGQEVIQGMKDADDMTLVAGTGRNDTLAAVVQEKHADVVVDFTHPSVVYQNIISIIEGGANAVVGTTGITEKQKKVIDSLAKEKGVGVLLAPNFSIGAILMMQFAAEASKYLNHIAIVEFHHDRKADAPSGTAIKTAEYIHSHGKTSAPMVQSIEQMEGVSQGLAIGNIHVHAVRLPGFVASQEVILGAVGQTLKIRHDTIDRKAFIPGVLIGIRKILGCRGLIDGLEHLIK
jgi:4-hydroxy-tetrahydrodipicolinate reductase